MHITSRTMETKPSTERIRVVVVDDHPVVRSGIILHLSRAADVEVVGEAADGDEGWRLAQSLSPQVLILDINMPGIPAIEMLPLLAKRETSPHVLIVTAFNDISHIMGLLGAGAKGYLLKDEEPSAIVAAVRAVARGKTWISSAVMEDVVKHAMHQEGQIEQDELSERELEVLHFLAEGKDNQDIANRLAISERTVRYHLRNIYDKLGVQRRGEAIAWAVRRRLNRT